MRFFPSRAIFTMLYNGTVILHHQPFQSQIQTGIKAMQKEKWRNDE
jgi:hypothetical protein